MTDQPGNRRALWRIVNKVNPVYLAYTGDTDPVDAIEGYREKFNDEPEEVFTDSGLLMCGPVEAK